VQSFAQYRSKRFPRDGLIENFQRITQLADRFITVIEIKKSGLDHGCIPFRAEEIKKTNYSLILIHPSTFYPVFRDALYIY
jgi:hypothetical protein